MSPPQHGSKFCQVKLLFVFVFYFGVNLYFLNLSWLPRPNTESTIAQEHLAMTMPRQHENDTIILMWFWPFEQHFDLNSCSSVFNIEGCYLTDDRTLYSKAHGVIIHHRAVNTDLSNLPTEPRPYFQKWVWMNFQSPINTPRIPGLDNLFNVTMNYRRDSDIPIREQMILKSEDAEDDIFPEVLKKKDKLVCWTINNWNKQEDRVKYYNELKNYIHVETYGRAFNKAINDEDYNNVLTTCKFYLSFENTINHYDYITEKLYNPLTKGSVPVVLGPPRYIYERFLPSDSFIHVEDFATPKELAEHLRSLDKNEDQYKMFFNWRKYYRVKHVNFPMEHVCLACHYIQTKQHYQAFTNLSKWYWDNLNL